MQLHEGAQVGLYSNLINQAPFDQNLGLLGFYGEVPQRVQGIVAPVFFDVELATSFEVALEIPLWVSNNLNFIDGNFYTDRALSDRYVGLLQNAFAVGASDFSKADGFVQVVQQNNVVFPVGDESQLRPLTFQAGEAAPLLKCAYFRDDPTASAVYGVLNPALKPREIETIGTVEFWRLEGAVPGTVTLSWNSRSGLAGIAPSLEQVELVGWHKASGRWLALGTPTRGGDLTDGFAISGTFVPDDYEVLTFAGGGVAEEVFDLPNYYLSPNGDGLNDFLVIEELAESPNNELRIYDRRGLLVFEASNYQNTFNGFSNTDNLVLDRQAGLPEGVYFYVVRLLDLGTEYQGFLYLNR
jgi:gliding motility-associated-like protein